MSKIRRSDFDRVVARFYQSAYGRDDWRDPLEALATLFDGSRAWLMNISDRGVQGATSIEDPEFHSDEAQFAMTNDPLFHHTRSCLEGDIKSHSELEDIAEHRRRELFQNWLRPRDAWFGLQGHLRVSERSRIFVDISRNRNQGDFTGADKELLALLGPHILRSGEIAQLLHQTADLHAATIPAAIVVDQKLRIAEMNERAADLISNSRTPLTISGGMLQLTGSNDSAKLEALTLDAVSGSHGHGGGMMLSDPPGDDRRMRLVISVAPFVRPDLFGFNSGGLAAVFVRSVGGAANEALEGRLRELFGLPPSHARLAVAIADGITVRQAAVERGLTYASARTYLEQIYRKTGTRQQAELVALLKAIEAIG